MAFIVEDGTGLEDANSLCSVEFADSYFEDRLNQVWTDPYLSEEDKQAALIEGTDYITIVWEDQLKYDRETEVQALPYPRTTIGYPELIKKVVAEYAVRAISKTLLPDVAQNTSGKIITSESKKLDVLQKQVTYSEYSEASNIQSYPVPDNMIKPLLKPSTNFLKRG